MAPAQADRRGDRSWPAAVLDHGEYLLNAAVAVALAVGGILLFGVVVYDFVRRLGHGSFVTDVLALLSGLLLVFIFTELISTLRVVLATRRITAEPFLTVGMVAAIRRVIVIGAAADKTLGTPHFRDLILEVIVQTAAVLVFGVIAHLLRRARRTVERPSGDEPAGSR